MANEIDPGDRTTAVENVKAAMGDAIEDLFSGQAARSPVVAYVQRRARELRGDDRASGVPAQLAEVAVMGADEGDPNELGTLVVMPTLDEPIVLRPQATATEIPAEATCTAEEPNR